MVVHAKAAHFVRPRVAGFAGPGSPRNYDLAPDGRRFLMIKDAASATPDASLVFIENWYRTLGQTTPAR